MLTVFRRYKRSIIGALIAGFAVILMISWGIDARGSFRRSGGPQKEAIRVGTHTISELEYYREVERETDQMKMRLGENYNRFRAMLNIEKEMIEVLINRVLLTSFVQSVGLTASLQQIQQQLAAEPFFMRTGLTQEAYRRFLAANGMTDEMLEERIGTELAERQLFDAIADLAMPSEPEIHALFTHENTGFELSYLAVRASAFESKVDQSEDKLKHYFETNGENYKKPRSVRYRFVRFDPAEFLSQVSVSDDEIRERYERRQSVFSEPKQINLSQIVFKKKDSEQSPLEQMVAPASAKPDVKALKHDLAKKVVERLRGGEDFATIAGEASEDEATKAKGGSLGWLKVSEIDKNLRQVADQLESGKFSDVLETPEAYVVLFAAEIKERRTKELSEVRDQVLREIQNEQAPEYARVSSEEFSGKWQDKPEMGLDAYAAQEKRTAVDSERLLTAGEDPPAVPAGLTKQLLALPKGERAIKHAGNSEFVVEILETKDAHVPALDEVRAAVLKDYVAAESDRLAREAASQTLADLQKSQASTQKKTLADVAGALSAEVKSTGTVSPKSPGNDELLMVPEARQVVFALTEQSPLAPKVLGDHGTYYLAALKQRTSPDDKTYAAQRIELVRSEHDAVNMRSRDFVLKALRGATEIWVNPELLDRIAKNQQDV